MWVSDLYFMVQLSFLVSFKLRLTGLIRIRPKSDSPSYYSLIFKKSKKDIETKIQQSYEGTSSHLWERNKKFYFTRQCWWFTGKWLWYHFLLFVFKSLHMEVCNLTAVLDEETRDIKNLITHKYCLNNQPHDSSKHFSKVAIFCIKL